MSDNFKSFPYIGLALDPIHVGTGGARLGRVDNTIVRDPVTRIPKIPGSSFAGVFRAYAAMAKGKYPDCAGQGQPRSDGSGGHCGKADCPICTVFGFARGNAGGFAGLAAFSDGQVLLFPVATREGPLWVTSPTALRVIEGLRDVDSANFTEHAIYRQQASPQPLNLGWLMLPVKESPNNGSDVPGEMSKLGIPSYIKERIAIVSDKLFAHVINSNLVVRTSVSIDPKTGAAEEGALFTYEALPRGTVVYWEVTCRNPQHYKVGGNSVSAVNNPDAVNGVVAEANPYLEHLGIGGMGTRGMGRLRVLKPTSSAGANSPSSTGGGN
jgi:CRISPR-associated protein Cmr4